MTPETRALDCATPVVRQGKARGRSPDGPARELAPATRTRARIGTLTRRETGRGLGPSPGEPSPRKTLTSTSYDPRPHVRNPSARPARPPRPGRALGARSQTDLGDDHLPAGAG